MGLIWLPAPTPMWDACSFGKEYSERVDGYKIRVPKTWKRGKYLAKLSFLCSSLERFGSIQTK